MGYTSIPPCGFDRADGLGVRPGTPTPANALQSSPDIFNISALVIEEDPNSPEIERGEQATFRHTFTVDWNTGLILSRAMPRGAYIRDSRGYTYKILSTNLNSRRGNLGTFIVTSESISFDNPPDEFHAQAIELNPEIEKHPMFWNIVGNGIDQNPFNLDSLGNKLNASFLSGPQIVSICKSAADAVSLGSQSDILTVINNASLGNNSNVQTLALTKLYPRYLRSENTFYLAGYRVVWSRYFFAPPLMDGGGYIQDPVTEGGLPPYFWSTTQGVGGDNIFLKLAKMTNPDIYQRGLSWLRLADELEYQRTWYHLTHTWLGGPLGHWDPDLYPNRGRTPDNPNGN